MKSGRRFSRGFVLFWRETVAFEAGTSESSTVDLFMFIVSQAHLAATWLIALVSNNCYYY